VEVGRLIIMVAPTGAPSQNSSSQYPTIRRSEASEARTLDDRLGQNINSDFNTVRLQTIMELIQRMALEGSPLIALAQHGAEAANQVIAVE
jgi:ribosomal protein S25